MTQEKVDNNKVETNQVNPKQAHQSEQTQYTKDVSTNINSIQNEGIKTKINAS